MPQNTRVLISGASIAGPAVSLWLARYGFDVTVVEKAPEVRRGGRAVDFKGATHRTVLERMGILDDVRKARTISGGDGFIVNANGRKIATIPAEFSGGEIEIARGDLARILFERTAETCEYVFGDSVASLKKTPDGVEVTFERSAPRVFDPEARRPRHSSCSRLSRSSTSATTWSSRNGSWPTLTLAVPGKFRN